MVVKMAKVGLIRYLLRAIGFARTSREKGDVVVSGAEWYRAAF